MCVCVCLCVCVCINFGTEEGEITDFKELTQFSCSSSRVSLFPVNVFVYNVHVCQQLLLSVSSLNVLDQTAFSFLYIYCFNFFNRFVCNLDPDT